MSPPGNPNRQNILYTKILFAWFKKEGEYVICYGSSKSDTVLNSLLCSYARDHPFSTIIFKITRGALYIPQLPFRIVVVDGISRRNFPHNIANCK